MMKNWDVFSLHKYDVGHTPHWKHKIEPTSNEPVFVKQFKIAVGDEEALDEMSTHLTAAKILIQQPSDNNTPIQYTQEEDHTRVKNNLFKTSGREMLHQKMTNTP